MYWSVRSLGKRGSGVLAGQLGITRDTHSHQLTPNPFVYKVHQKATDQYQKAVSLALAHREAHQTYSAIRQVLNSLGLSINRKTYYNLVRGKLFDRHLSNFFKSLVLALEEMSFKFAYLISNDLADDDSL